MKTLKLTLGCLIAAAFSLGQASPPRRLRINGLTDGLHADGKPGHLLADAALTTRYLLVKRGSDAAHFAVCGAGDKPLGPCLDEPSAAEAAATIALLGAVKGTVPVVGSAIIAVDADVYTAANGKVQGLPAAAGTYYRIGKAFTACVGDGDRFFITPQKPERVVVIAVATAATVATADGSDAGTTQTLANALKVELNKVIADQAALRAALATPSTLGIATA